jgi:hypothetical protein
VLFATGWRKHRFAAAAASCLVLALVTAACGSSGSQTPASSASSAGSSSASTSSTGSASSPPAASTTSSTATTPTPAKHLQISYTAPDGWQYSGTLSLPNVSWSFSKSISSSPPGQAQLKASMSGDQPSSTVTGLNDTNSGRPNGPQLTWVVETVYELKSSFPDIGDVGTCSTQTDAGNYGGYPFATFLRCEIPDVANGGLGNTSDGAAGSGSTGSISENEVDSAIGELSSEAPIYVLGFNDVDSLEYGLTCHVFLNSTTDAVTPNAGWSDHECGTLHVSVTS